MLNKEIEQEFILVAIPPEYKSLRNTILKEINESRFVPYIVEKYNLESIPQIPANVKGCFLFNDKTFEFGMFLAYFTPFISKLLVLSEEDLTYIPQNVILYNPKYKKISNVFKEYIDNIKNGIEDIVVNTKTDGYTFDIKGSIKLNPYKGMLISFDHPNYFNKLSNGGNELIETVLKRLNNDGIEYVDIYTPSEQAIGGLVKSALYNNYKILPDTLQLLFIADRIEFLKTIEPLLMQGKIVITNYFSLSNLAYSYEEMPLGFLLAGNSQAYWPDISFIVTAEHIPVIGKPHTNTKIFDTEEKQSKINEGFKRIVPLFSKSVTHLSYSDGIEVISKKAVTTIKKHYKYKNLVNSKS